MRKDFIILKMEISMILMAITLIKMVLILTEADITNLTITSGPLNYPYVYKKMESITRCQIKIKRLEVKRMRIIFACLKMVHSTILSGFILTVKVLMKLEDAMMMRDIIFHRLMYKQSMKNYMAKKMTITSNLTSLTIWKGKLLQKNMQLWRKHMRDKN